MSYSIVGTRTAYDGWSSLFVATIRTPDGNTIKREIEDHGIAVAILPYDPERRIAMLVRQFRPPVFHATAETDILEAPAGIVDDDEAPETAARREADEEVGLRLSTLEPLGLIWTMPGISTERLHLFLAPFSERDRTGNGGGLAHEHEEITLVETPLSELAAMAEAGRISDLKTLALVQSLRLRHPELF